MGVYVGDKIQPAKWTYAKAGLLAVLLLGLGFLALALVGVFQWGPLDRKRGERGGLQLTRPELKPAQRCQRLLEALNFQALRVHGVSTTSTTGNELTHELLSHLKVPILQGHDKVAGDNPSTLHLFFPSSSPSFEETKFLNKINLKAREALAVVGLGSVSNVPLEENVRFPLAQDEDLLTRMYHGEVGATTQAEMFYRLHGLVLWNAREEDVLHRLETLEYHPEKKASLARRGQRLVRAQHTLLNRLEEQLLLQFSRREEEANVVVVSDDHRVLGRHTTTLTWNEWVRHELAPASHRQVYLFHLHHDSLVHQHRADKIRALWTANQRNKTVLWVDVLPPSSPKLWPHDWLSLVLDDHACTRTVSARDSIRRAWLLADYQWSNSPWSDATLDPSKAESELSHNLPWLQLWGMPTENLKANRP